MHNDKKRYMILMSESMNDIENMLMKAQEDICAKLGITQEILEKVDIISEWGRELRVGSIGKQASE